MPFRRSTPLGQLPEGFAYSDDFVAEEEAPELLERIRGLPFGEVLFQGYVAKRRIVSFGLEYDFSTRKTSGAVRLPDFLVSLRDRAAVFAKLDPAELAEAIVTEYPPGAPIGWHRDSPQFETIVGISFGSACWMQLKPYPAPGSVLSVVLRPRSIYVLSGVSRWKFQHSIVAVEEVRYSITFRMLRG